MAVGNLNIEFLNHNAQRRYPLADDAEGVDGTGAFRLPDDFLVEMRFPVHAGMNVGPAGFYLQSVAAFAGGYGLTVGYQPADGSDPVVVASALIPRQNFTRNSTFVLGGVGDFADTHGFVTIGRLENIDDQPPGYWEFALSATRLDPDATDPYIRGISSITCVNGDQRSVPLYGDIELVAGPNMQIIPILVEGQDPVIKFSAISGEGTVETCVCEGDAAQTEPIKKINGVTPTNSGDLNIVGSDCVQIVAIPNGIRIVDVCSQPCCGCVELERITQDMERLGIQVAGVTQFVDRLQESVNTMDLVVLGAKLNDRGCISCE